MRRRELEELYRQAVYRVRHETGTLDLRIGVAARELDRWLVQRGAARWGLVTAANPGSVRLGEAENGRRLARLEALLLRGVAALLVALPVVWVYGWTRPRRRYNQTFAQTLIVLPIAITLVVLLVKGSLALAFSLAGIVAAVSFSTALEEPLDGVYLFLVIGTGLAAGVRLLFVALIASVVFNAVTLTIWRLNVGSQPAVLEGWRLVERGGSQPIPDGAGIPLRPDAAIEQGEANVTSVEPLRSKARTHADE